jgi:hypothetical protein
VPIGASGEPLQPNQESTTTEMKSALRTRACTLSTAAASALIAFAFGCSGTDGSDLVTPGDGAPADIQDGAFEASQLASAVNGERAATERTETTGRAEQAQTPSRREGEGEGEGDMPASTVTSPAPTPSADEPVAEPAVSPEPAPVRSNVMRVVGNQLLDTCGKPFVVRGVEQILGEQLPFGNDWLGLVREIASTGANAVRILPGVNTLTTENVDEILTFIGAQGMVAFIDPLNSPDDWYARDDVKAMLKKHESFIIIDAYGEPQYDDIEKWRGEAKEALVQMRALGYEVPFTVYANQFGRGLPSLFDHGSEILAADPLHNTFLGWQAYWGNTGYYQEHYGYTLTEAVQAIVDSGLPIQMGLDHITDLPSTEADYGTLMQAAEANGVGWLWWDFYNPYGTENNLTEDGSTSSLTATGADVLVNHSASIRNTAKLACGH